MGAERVDSYFVCATPRTGSSLLLGLLESTGVCGRPQAYFRAPDEPLWARRWQLPRTADYAGYVRAARVAGSGPNGVFGAKLMWGTATELAGKLRQGRAGSDVQVLERAFGRCRFVYLTRRDVLAQAVSWVRAEQTGAWFAGGNGEISGNDGGGGREPVFDAEAIGRFVATIAEHNAAWEAWFAACGVRPHRVVYEDVDRDAAAAAYGIMACLGLAGRPPVAARHRRQADGLNQEWIARYRAWATRVPRR
ncbi:sulfotransferase [Paractinoplanes deccanensis]|uniref:Trehalose 2-sulfotransferase n=1 Tax=Paractinoplanes deccanensis TaxID=113561 RepID=A0ABQ3Y9X7_9ACTN|nr:Stf0 family sulfotransferase [Actinoplanes deccanensis]GID76807.1 sulfotransferase [Actinoplanes deccanensis]